MNNVTEEAPPIDLEAVVKELAELSPLEYDRVRKEQAKLLGVRVDTLDAEVKKIRGDDGSKDEGSQADIAITLFNKSGAKLFHDDQDVAFSEIPVNGHMEVWPVGSKQFGKMLNRMFWNDQNKALHDQARKDAVGTIAGLAEIEGEEHKVHLRVAFYAGRYYIDLCNEQWSVVEIDSAGWRVLDRSPVKFRRTSNMEQLPAPIPGGNFSTFWDITTIEEDDRRFVLAWMIDAIRADTQYPLLEIVGGHGTAKSTVHRFIRRLIDPNVIDLRGAPKSEDDIWVAARNNHCISLENLSSLSPKMQDVLCTVATGGGHAGRQLFTNYDEEAIRAINPTVINGINPVVTASDLSDRAIRVHLPKIKGENLREEHEINRAYSDAYQSMFSGLLDIFSAALALIDTIHLKNKPRMVSYSVLGEAICAALKWEGSFNDAYLKMRANLLIEATQSSPAISAIVLMIEHDGTFYGTYKELLSRLEDGQYRIKGEGWPGSPRGLSGLITRHEAGLAAMGIEVDREGHGRGGNKIMLKTLPPAEYRESGDDVHNVHNVHNRPEREGREHCEGHFQEVNNQPGEGFSSKQREDF